MLFNMDLKVTKRLYIFFYIYQLCYFVVRVDPCFKGASDPTLTVIGMHQGVPQGKGAL